MLLAARFFAVLVMLLSVFEVRPEMIPFVLHSGKEFVQTVILAHLVGGN